ncbi:adenylate cyclase, putative [Ixodes scapularis]|uniref:adenylate cyclase n=1 Tax=Ixodes scapularis TaxID=6945 RepID=B7QMS5_IXOSC|nr:adenylate cyclase, putative [Ixodes scapularis]|eukprot:XP_002400250.1 adenylate cyclase, putative [Ixodes scapularis]
MLSSAVQRRTWARLLVALLAVLLWAAMHLATTLLGASEEPELGRTARHTTSVAVLALLAVAVLVRLSYLTKLAFLLLITALQCAVNQVGPILTQFLAAMPRAPLTHGDAQSIYLAVIALALALELYSKSHESVGVLFAAMPNFSDFYTEESVNNQGLECLRFLNEVISDFDALLEQPRFKDILKIKTIGSSYMAASGLSKEDEPGLLPGATDPAALWAPPKIRGLPQRGARSPNGDSKKTPPTLSAMTAASSAASGGRALRRGAQPGTPVSLLLL